VLLLCRGVALLQERYEQQQKRQTAAAGVWGLQPKGLGGQLKGPSQQSWETLRVTIACWV